MKTRKKPFEKPRYTSQRIETCKSYYLEEYKTQVVSHLYHNKENEAKLKQIKIFLETILEQAEEKIEEKPQEIQKQREESNSPSLEGLIKQTKKENEKYITRHKYPKDSISEKLNTYIFYLNPQATSHRINQETGAHVFYVSSSMLPPGVLGMYLPNLHVYYVANDISPAQMKWVDFHEEYHSKYGAGEAQADDYATRKLGFNPFAPRQHSMAA